MFLPFARHSRSTPSKGQSPRCVELGAEGSGSVALGAGYTTALKICFSAPSSTYVNRTRRAKGLGYTQLSTRGSPRLSGGPARERRSGSSAAGDSGPMASSSRWNSQRM